MEKRKTKISSTFLRTFFFKGGGGYGGVGMGKDLKMHGQK